MKKERHNYEYDFDLESNTAPANVVSMVGKNKSVLEIGCGPGSISKVLAKKNGCKVVGLEIDQSAIDKAAAHCVSVLKVDLNSTDWPFLLDNSAKFDVVVAADVLEHLHNPWKSLQQMSTFIGPDGYMVISLPHVGHASVMACILNGDFEYRNWGLLDRTHIRFFCLKNVEHLVAQAGLKIIEFAYVTKHPEESEFAEKWDSLSSNIKDVLRSTPFSDVYQVVFKAVPIEYSGEGLALTASRHKFSDVGGLKLIKRKLAAHLSPETKIYISKVLRFFGIAL